MLELVTAVLVEVTALPLVLAYDGIYGLMGYRQPLLWQTARDLFRRPLLLLEQPYSLLLDVLSDRSVARATMLMIESILLGCLLVIASLRPLFRLSSRDMVDGLTFIAVAMSFFFIPCWSKIEIAYLCSEVICLYILQYKSK